MSSARVNKKLLNRWRLDRYSSSSTTNGNRATNFSSRSVQPLLSSRFSRSQTNRGSFLASLSTNDTYIKKRCDDDERAENKSSKSSSFLSHLSLFAAAADPSTATTALETVNNNTTTTIDPTIWNYFLQTLISTTVPSVVICSCVGITVLLLRQSPQQKDKKSTSLTSSSYTRNNAARELYDDLYAPISKKEREPPLKELARMLRESSSPSKSTEAKEIRRLNKGIPAQEFIRVKHWNQILDSYQYSLTVATQSKAKAAAWLRSQNFDRALGRAFHPATLVKNSFSNHTKQQLLNLEKTFLKEGSKLVQQIQHLQTQLTQTVIDKEISNMGIENCYEMDPKVVERDSDSDQEQKEGDKDPGNPSVQDIAEQKDLMTMKERKSREKMMSELSQAQNDLMQLELSFVSDVISTMGSQYAAGIRTALLGDIAARGSGGLLTQLQERPLTSILEALESTRDDNSQGAENVPDSDSAMNNSSIDLPMPRKKNNPGTLFVSRFSGDIRASQVTKLREEVTAILRNARPGIDEALVVLESGGGTVTGYGLAAGQLQRLKDHGIKLTIAVEQVAASGGYMMCCVADRIVGSPFAIFGSIGVLTEIPNVYDRLKREGVEFQTVTAGKYKRTITPFKEVTDEDYKKTKEQVEDIHRMFKDFVHKSRPQLNIDDVATGEIWFGNDAIKVGLCDDIATVDDIMTQFVDNEWNVYELEYKKPLLEKRDITRFIPSGDDDAEVEAGTTNDKNIWERAARWFIQVFASELNSIVRKEVEEGLPKSENSSHRFAAHYSGADKFRVEEEKVSRQR